jgi:hypothetical protein
VSFTEEECPSTAKTHVFSEGKRAAEVSDSKWFRYYYVRETSCKYIDTEVYLSLVSDNHVKVSVTPHLTPQSVLNIKNICYYKVT